MPQRLILERTGCVLVADLRWARGSRARRIGLRRRRSLEPGEALAFERAPHLHTFGMSFPIDVVFCDHEWRVLHRVEGLTRCRLTRFVPRARYTVEMAAGAAGVLRRGDRLLLEGHASERYPPSK